MCFPARVSAKKKAACQFRETQVVMYLAMLYTAVPQCTARSACSSEAMHSLHFVHCFAFVSAKDWSGEFDFREQLDIVSTICWLKHLCLSGTIAWDENLLL